MSAGRPSSQSTALPRTSAKIAHPKLALADPHRCIVQISQLGSAQGNPEWLQTLRQRHDQREEEIAEMARTKVEGINPIDFFQQLDAFLNDDSILIGDGGDFVATAAYVLQPRAPYSWLDPGVFGTLGVGAGFAISAQLHRPEAETWLIYGDGAGLLDARDSIPVCGIRSQ